MSDFTNIEVPPAVVRHIRQQAISDCIAAVEALPSHDSQPYKVAMEIMQARAIIALREVTL